MYVLARCRPLHLYIAIYVADTTVYMHGRTHNYCGHTNAHTYVRMHTDSIDIIKVGPSLAPAPNYFYGTSGSKYTVNVS